MRVESLHLWLWRTLWSVHFKARYISVLGQLHLHQKVGIEMTPPSPELHKIVDLSASSDREAARRHGGSQNMLRTTPEGPLGRHSQTVCPHQKLVALKFSADHLFRDRFSMYHSVESSVSDKGVGFGDMDSL